jgi:tripartite-type tricarboxylate transporter receptor subunit TctC
MVHKYSRKNPDARFCRMATQSLVLALAVLFGLSAGVRAQTFPDRPVRMVVAFSAGGTLDSLARMIADQLLQKWGKAVIVVNRPGAGGTIGATVVAQSAPDGYTLNFGAQGLAVNVTIAPTPDFDPVKNYDPVILVATAQDVLMVSPSSPFHTVQDLIKAAKAEPNRLTFASVGSGSSSHLAAALFGQLTGTQSRHVPYTQLSQAITDLMTDRVSFLMATMGPFLSSIKVGKIRALAVSGSARSKALPDVPTFQELGIPYVEPASWYGIFAPKGTPRPVIAKINADVNEVLRNPDFRKRSAALEFTLLGGSPEVLDAKLKSEIRKWAGVAKAIGLAP